MSRTMTRRSLFAALFVAAMGVMISGSSLLAEDKCSNCRGGGAGGCNSAGCNGGGCDGGCDGSCGAGAGGYFDAHGRWVNSGGQMTVDHGHPNLFYNFYVPPMNGPGATAYMAPITTPAHVGHTYVTYQPLMPHEFLYQPHHKRYYRYYAGGRGLNRTHVQYYRPPVLSQAHSVLSMFKLAR